ncbi:hypothetical protein Pint_17149 [Pistacia integerrima]|uniref:Uncharacterized protein n=1 Tax=Pistacia integerrima TaxID=434235 RepID=A0ACC0YUV9_9ROSI|nr:hypothetical protein Pint_17149 [Pistacia integerrima]
MAMAKSAVTVFSIMALFGAAMATTYTVGDKAGWTIQGSPDYEKWAGDKTFKVGDILFFKYNPAMHDVKQVSKADYEACNGKSAIATYTTGADSITLKEPGKAYFLCSFTGHCKMGQKLEVNVVGSAASPHGSPAASPEGAAAAAPKSETASSPNASAINASTPTASEAGGVAPTAPTSSGSSSTKYNAGLVSAVLSVAAAFAL